jgi:CRISPR/Cas system CMR-associated protein Cmr5 small subunit
MDKETTIIIIAQNGLKTAAAYFTSKFAKLDKQAEKATDPAVKSKLTKSAAKVKKLASVLNSADQGLTSYLAENSSDE